MPISTSCKECIFATYDGKSQTGCELGRIEKFKKLDCIIEAFDEDKEFYIVNGRFCLACRDREWGEKIPPNRWKDVVKRQMQIQYQVIIFLTHNLDDLKTTLDSLSSQTIQPKHITIIQRAKNKLRPGKITQLIDGYYIEWRLQHLEHKVRDGDAVDLVLDKVKHQLYLVIESGYVFSKNMLSNLNHVVNEDLLHFGILKPKKENYPMIVASSVHTIYNGSAFGKSLEQKMRDDKLDDKILDVEKIC